MNDQAATAPSPPSAREALTPQALAMLQAIDQAGSFAGAARSLGMVPSALTYRVRQIEEALDVLLFDRSSRRARPTAAGAELLRASDSLLEAVDAITHQVRSVATGWESRLTIAVDNIVSKDALFDLCADFYALHPATRLRLRDEVLSGGLDAVAEGRADLAIGVPDHVDLPDVHSRALGDLRMVFAVAPGHPLARAREPLSDKLLRRHRAVAVADSTVRGAGLTFGLFDGQEVLTVASMQDKLHAQMRALGSGFLPECMARPHIETGALVERRTERALRQVRPHYAWRLPDGKHPGRALQWWLDRLDSPRTRAALLAHGGARQPAHASR
jgi:DNA-binding transcriptional LysR family regulator